jgi:hypothetical protein
VLWISQKDFMRLARAFPFMETYFKDYIEKTSAAPTWSSLQAAPSAATSSNPRIDCYSPFETPLRSSSG